MSAVIILLINSISDIVEHFIDINFVEVAFFTLEIKLKILSRWLAIANGNRSPRINEKHIAY